MKGTKVSYATWTAVMSLRMIVRPVLRHWYMQCFSSVLYKGRQILDHPK